MKAFSTLTARAAFGFRPNGTGRIVNVKQGDKFENTTGERNGQILIARYRTGKLGIGWAFSPEQIAQLFTIEV